MATTHPSPPTSCKYDDVDNDDASISKYVACNYDANPILIYADNNALFHSDHKHDEHDDHILGANNDEDGDGGGDCDGGE